MFANIRDNKNGTRACLRRPYGRGVPTRDIVLLSHIFSSYPIRE